MSVVNVSFTSEKKYIKKKTRRWPILELGHIRAQDESSSAQPPSPFYSFYRCCHALEGIWDVWYTLWPVCNMWTFLFSHKNLCFFSSTLFSFKHCKTFLKNISSETFIVAILDFLDVLYNNLVWKMQVD